MCDPIPAHSKRKAKEANVEIEYTGDNYLVQCKACGHAWYLNSGSGGRFPRGWWKCPNGCNVPED
jgi:hypothetical protein